MRPRLVEGGRKEQTGPQGQGLEPNKEVIHMAGIIITAVGVAVCIAIVVAKKKRSA